MAREARSVLPRAWLAVVLTKGGIYYTGQAGRRSSRRYSLWLILVSSLAADHSG